jgi:thymidylate synthase
MYFSNSTVDDLLRRVLEKLLATKRRNNATRGANAELTGVLLQLTNPRSRLSRTEKKGKVFSCLGELLWYLAGTNRLAFIEYYVPRYAEDSEDKITIHGAYGPRLFNVQRAALKINQIQNVLELLKRKPTSRRAVIQLFDAADLSRDYKEIIAVPRACVK